MTHIVSQALSFFSTYPSFFSSISIFRSGHLKIVSHHSLYVLQSIHLDRTSEMISFQRPLSTLKLAFTTLIFSAVYEASQVQAAAIDTSAVHSSFSPLKSNSASHAEPQIVPELDDLELLSFAHLYKTQHVMQAPPALVVPTTPEEATLHPLPSDLPIPDNRPRGVSESNIVSGKFRHESQFEPRQTIPNIMVVGDSISQGAEGDWTWRYR